MQDYMCQKYNDHVYGSQVDNKFQMFSHYSVYDNLCGTGQEVVCPTPNCSAQCQIMRGGFSAAAMTLGSAGVLSIRNVTFRPNYRSPVEAGPDNLDFIAAFYHAGVQISASLINAYTINRARLQNLRADLVNHYHDGTTTNNGARLPTMLRLSGHLTLSEYASSKSIRLYLPSSLSFAPFIDGAQHTVGCSTGRCTGFQGGLSLARDTWTSMSSV